MKLEQLLEVFGQYVWPLLVGAFLYLHRMGRRNERDIAAFKVHVAENYNNKKELGKLFNDLRQHFDTRIEDVKKTITLTANKAELTFEVTTDKYNKYINELSLSNKIAPAHNFLMRCVVEDSRPALKELLEQPGFAVQIASFVVEEFQPDLTLALGK